MEKKTLTKKIIITVLLGLLVGFGIFYMIFEFPAFLHYSETILIYKDNFPQESLMEVIKQYKTGLFIILLSYLHSIGNIIIDIILISKIWKK